MYLLTHAIPTAPQKVTIHGKFLTTASGLRSREEQSKSHPYDTDCVISMVSEDSLQVVRHCVHRPVHYRGWLSRHLGIQKEKTQAFGVKYHITRVLLMLLMF
jgi:hypothetical protein